ncbi:MAG: HAD hydrolase-like protein [Candidatus Pacebacteria bacterium]|nr:HAD hydrolase-like protein [Candidatus Paceibacterota bacterium]
MTAIFFDLDRTLFNTSQLAANVNKKLCQQLKITQPELENHFNNYYQTIKSSTDFSPTNFCHSLEKQTNQSNLSNIFFNPLHYQNCLYSDVVASLNKLKNQTNSPKLGLWSQSAERRFQQAKINFTNLTDFFDPGLILISPDKNSAAVISQIPENSLVIDDKLTHLKALRQARSDLTVVQITRADKQSTQKNLDSQPNPQTETNIPVITSLSQLSQFI